MNGRLLFVLASVATIASGCYDKPRSYDGGDHFTSPYSPITSIEIRVAPSGGHEVTLEVYNVKGEKMGRTSLGVVDTTTTFKLEDLWKLTTDSLGNTDSSLVRFGSFEPGVYFYRLRANDSTLVTKKLMLLK